jgi:hypothetical protein
MTVPSMEYGSMEDLISLGLDIGRASSSNLTRSQSFRCDSVSFHQDGVCVGYLIGNPNHYEFRRKDKMKSFDVPSHFTPSEAKRIAEGFNELIKFNNSVDMTVGTAQLNAWCDALTM